MALLTPSEHEFAECISDLVVGNPFVPERITKEKQALGDDFTPTPRVWSLLAETDSERENLAKLVERVEPLTEKLRARLEESPTSDRETLDLYENLVLYMLYQHDRMDLQKTIVAALEGKRPTGPLSFWRRFKTAFDRYLCIPGLTMPSGYEAAHVFATFFQIRRAFYHIFSAIVGGSLPAARLRAAVWESIFTHDLRRYHRGLYRNMTDYTTLVTGPSGTGKELVARAIAQSHYIPFDAESEKFTEDFSSAFHALNISALSPTLVESELFGHKRGTFTGAVADRAGWLEICGPRDTVFLDEIGDLDPGIQVKLLRVLQTRTFQRLGETTDRHFHGKIIAATNRDVAGLVEEGGFRTDFYYRLCSDIISTPSLREQLADAPDDLYNLVLFITKRIVDEGAAPLAREVADWITKNLGPDYPWPGNFRELEQCVRNMLIRRSYQPPQKPTAEPRGALDRLAVEFKTGELTAEELLRRYCTLVYAQCGSYQATARRIGLDRRTVQAKIDRALLESIRDE